MGEILNDYAEDKDNFKKTADIKSILKYGNAPDGDVDLTITIPTYHRVDGLRKALHSIFKQNDNGMRFRVIIVDNDNFELAGSDTEKILRKYPEDKVSYYQNQVNIGMVGNWNKCLKLAKSKWIAMLHDDDILSNRYFILVKPILRRVDNSNIVYVKATNGFIGDDGKPIERNYFAKKLHTKYANTLMIFNRKSYDFIGPQNVGWMGTPSYGTLINREIFTQYGGYNEDHYPSFDAYFPERLATRHGFQIAITSGFLGYSYDKQSTSTKEATILAWSKEYIEYSSKYYAKRSRLASFLYRLFCDEMGQNFKKEMMTYISISTLLSNKAEVIKKVEDILKYRNRPLRRKIYDLFFLLYKRNKQIQALISG